MHSVIVLALFGLAVVAAFPATIDESSAIIAEKAAAFNGIGPVFIPAADNIEIGLKEFDAGTNYKQKPRGCTYFNGQIASCDF